MAQSLFIYRYPFSVKPLNVAYCPGYEWTVHQVRIHFSADPAPAAEILTITIDGGYTAAVHDTQLAAQDMDGVLNSVYTPDAPMQLGRLDYLDIVYANTAAITHGVEIVFTTRE